MIFPPASVIRLRRAPRNAATLLLLLLAACTGVPEGVEPISGFDLERYLGTWYEVGRFDHRFERGLEQVTATYSLRDDGGVKVVNRGFDAEAGEWRESVGKAYPVGAPDVGRLKVSFFGPFYGGYNIVALGDAYDHALVVGPDRSYLWILSRTPSLEPAIFDALVERARSLDFPVDDLIRVSQVAEGTAGR